MRFLLLKITKLRNSVYLSISLKRCYVAGVLFHYHTIELVSHLKKCVLIGALLQKVHFTSELTPATWCLIRRLYLQFINRKEFNWISKICYFDTKCRACFQPSQAPIITAELCLLPKMHSVLIVGTRETWVTLVQKMSELRSALLAFPTGQKLSRIIL